MRTTARVIGLIGILSSVAMPAAAQKERAAAIEYAFVARPAALAAEFAAPAGATLRFLEIDALDGGRVEAALWQPEGRAPADTPLVVAVHGSGESYATGPVAILSRGLPATGRAVLAISTRQSGARVNTDNFLDVRRDIEAAVATARALGFRSLVLHGHSLGNIQVLYYAANDWTPAIRAVVLTGMFGNLPWKSRHVLIRNEENYKALHKAAVEALAAGRAADKLPIDMGWIVGNPVPVSGQHFLTYRWDHTSTADGTYWIRRVPRPILMVRDEGDAVVLPFEPYQLLTAATAEGSLVRGIKYVPLPNPKGANPRGHSFADNEGPLVAAVDAWLKEHGL